MTVRVFTREEDEMILLHVQGKFGIRVLQLITKAARGTLEARARELGVTLNLRPPRHDTVNKSRIFYEPRPDDGKTFVCTVGENDPLLAALHLHYPERRYATLHIRRKIEKQIGE